MEEPGLDERLGEIQDGTTPHERFAALCLCELLREVCQFERGGGELVAWEWEGRVRDVAAVCGLDQDEAGALWEWCADISGDFLLEPEDPWEVGLLAPGG